MSTYILIGLIAVGTAFVVGLAIWLERRR